MLKLKYLFHNEALAHMILDNWEYDHDDPHLLKYFRISSNAIYWCRNEGKTFILRFAPQGEKSKEKIQGELDFLRFLRSNGYPAAETILSKSGNELEEVKTPWGIYYAVAFKVVDGKQIEQVPFTDDIIVGWGRALGRLHKLSSQYKSESNMRSDWREMLEWIEAVLEDYPEETDAKAEAGILKEYFSRLEVTKDNFGLIHFDFESDNLFFDEENKKFIPIDYDDSMYHWFVMDIERALNSVMEEAPDSMKENAPETFIKGYRMEYDVSDEMLSLMPIFRRFANLYGYTRVIRSAEEKWNNEPEWMAGLRGHFNYLLGVRKCDFGKPV